jgi:hypothetical protein
MTEREPPLFTGHQPRECGEHRTAGPLRAWCFADGEWCYPDPEMACRGCRIPVLEAQAGGGENDGGNRADLMLEDWAGHGYGRMTTPYPHR